MVGQARQNWSAESVLHSGHVLPSIVAIHGQSSFASSGYQRGFARWNRFMLTDGQIQHFRDEEALQ